MPQVLLRDFRTELCKAILGWLGLSLMLLATSVAAQTNQVADWRQAISGGVGSAIARAPNGDYVVVGIETPSSTNPAYGASMTLQRYSSSGQPAWAQAQRTTTTVAGLKPSSVLVDAGGNTYVLANEADYNFIICTPSPCADPLPPTLFNAWWIVQKYSPAGALLWQKRTLQVGRVPVQGAVDSTGDLYVALDPNSAGVTATVQRLSGTTGATLWTASTPDGAKPGAIALSSSGTVLLAAAGTFFGVSINEFAADTGARLTRTNYPTAAGYYAPAMALGPQGEIAFTGSSADGLFIGLETASRQPVFSLSTIPGAKGNQIAIDAQGRLVVAGTAPGVSGSNWLLLRYSPTGTPLHAPVIIDRHASAAETPLGLVVAADAAAYVTGAAGPGTTADPNATQAVTVRLASGGNVEWLASEPDGLRGVGAVLAADNSVAVLTAGNMSLVHYAAAAGPTPTSLALSSASVKGGKQVTGRVGLSNNTGAVVQLTSSNPTVASVPSTVNVAAGSTSASFAIQTSRVTRNTSVTITATANGKSTSVVLNVLR